MKIHLSNQDASRNPEADSEELQSRERDDAYPSAEETALWVALNRAQRSIYRSMDSALKANGLPPLRWYDILWSLERAKESGLRPFELEKMLIFEQSNLSRLLRRMIDAGLVEESTFQDDRRGKVLALTSKGGQIRGQMWKVYGPLIHEHMNCISEQFDLTNIAYALKSLSDQDVGR
ncbi:MAG: MarR family winged helix-turn-helix transcriptional regulator [Geminicoccaceae bacterium]